MLWSRWDSTFCLSVSYSFNMSSHLALSVSHLPFIVISHPRCSALQACQIHLPTVEPCIKMKPESAEVKKSVMWLMSLCYIFNTKWTPLITQIIHSIQCLLQNIGQLLIISEFSRRGMMKLNLEVRTELQNSQSECLCTLSATCTVVTSCYYVIFFNFTGEYFVNSDIWCCHSVNISNQSDMILNVKDSYETLRISKCHSWCFCNTLWHSRP